jgi:hypothetical protein
MRQALRLFAGLLLNYAPEEVTGSVISPSGLDEEVNRYVMPYSGSDEEAAGCQRQHSGSEGDACRLIPGRSGKKQV